MSSSSEQKEAVPFSFLPPYEDFVNQINSLFTPQVICGAKFNYVLNHQIKNDKLDVSIQSASEFLLQPLIIQIDNYGRPISGSSQEWSTSLSANITNYGGATIHLSNNGVLFNILGAPSPFLIGDFKCMYGGGKASGLISVNARQQISNINARFQMNKFEVPYFTEATAIFGSIKRALGFRFQYEPNGKNCYQILGRLCTKRLILQSDLSFIEDIRKNALVSVSIRKTASRGLNFGAQFKISKNLDKEFNLGWDFKIGKSRVHSFASTNKIISSSLRRDITNDLFFDVSATLDHNTNDAILGFGLTFNSEK